MSLLEQIQKDYIQAMKDKNINKKSALNYILAQIKNKKIELQKELEDIDIVKILKKEIKAIWETIWFLEKTDKKEELQAEKEKKLLLEFYLPQCKSIEETKSIIEWLISELGITELAKQRWQVMKEIKSRYGEEIDGSIANDVINSML